MAVNKVVMNTSEGEEVLIDLTRDTVKTWFLPEGVTAHSSDGKQISGFAKAFDKEMIYTPGIYDIYPGETGNAPVYFRYGLGVKGEPNLLPENIKSGVSIFGVVGTMETGGGGDDGPDTFFGIIGYNYYDGLPVIEEYLPFKQGMTWRDFCSSGFNGAVSGEPGTMMAGAAKITDKEDPEVYYYFYDYINAFLDYGIVRTSDGNPVGWDDLIQPYNGDPSSIYIAQF